MTAVFETMRVKGGLLPLLDRHLDRLEFGRVSLGLPELPHDLSRMLAGEAAAGPAEGILRVQWDGQLSMTRRDLPSLDPVSVVTSSVVHTGYRVKTTDREIFDRARAEARAHGADEGILLTEDGYVAEGSLFAIGWFEGDRIRVPSLDLGILPSIGRARALEVGTALGFVIEEGRFTRFDLEGRSSWICTSVRGVVPIVSLDGRPVPPDARAGRLAASFWPSA